MASTYSALRQPKANNACLLLVPIYHDLACKTVNMGCAKIEESNTSWLSSASHFIEKQKQNKTEKGAQRSNAWRLLGCQCALKLTTFTGPKARQNPGMFVFLPVPYAPLMYTSKTKTTNNFLGPPNFNPFCRPHR